MLILKETLISIQNFLLIRTDYPTKYQHVKRISSADLVLNKKAR